MKASQLNLIALSVISAGLTACGGAAKPQWEAYHPNGSTSVASVDAVAVDSYGNVIAVGTSDNPTLETNSDDIYVISHSASGKQNWIGRYDFSVNGRKVTEDVSDATIDEAGNVYVVGTAFDHTDFNSSSETSNAFDFVFLVKFDRFGSVLWTQTYGAPGILPPQDIEYANGVVTLGGINIRQVTPDGQLIRVLDQGDASFWDVEVDALGNVYGCGNEVNIKFNANGSVAWSLANPEAVSASCSVDITAAGGVVTGYDEYFNDRIRVNKISDAGKLVWSTTTAEAKSSAGAIAAPTLVKEAPDGSILAVSSSNQGRKLAKLTTDGREIWNRTSTDKSVYSLDVDAKGNSYIYGVGVGEKFDTSGKSLAKITLPYRSWDLEGRGLVSGSSLYVVDAIAGPYSKGAQGYTAKYANP